MTRAETKALKELAAKPDIVITNADEGSGIVIEDREKYIADGKEHLEDKNIYRMIDADPTLQLAKAINKYTSRMLDKGIIDSTTHSYLHFKQEQMPRTQQLYFLKKIHKNPIAVRPIVSGCGGPTENISQLVDLQPHVKKIDSYIKDTNHIIDLIENTTIPKNCILATIDVKALYLNIPHRDGIEAVLNRLYRNNPDSDDVEIPPETMRGLTKYSTDQKLLSVCRLHVPPSTGNGNGHKNGPSLRQSIHGRTGRKTTRQLPHKTSDMDR